MNPERLRALVYFLFGVSLCLSISGGYIFGLLVMGDLIFRAKKEERLRRWVLSPLDIPVLAYFSWGVFTSVWNGSASFLSSIRAQHALIFFVLFAHFFDEKDWHRLIWGFCAAGAVAGLWGILQINSGIVLNPTTRTVETPRFFAGWPEGILKRFASRLGRAVGTRSHPLTYAESLIPAFFVILTMIHKTWNEKKNKGFVAGIMFLALIFIVLGLVASQSRGVWLGVIFGTGLVVIINFRKFPFKTLGALLLVGILVFMASSQLRGRAMSIFSGSSGSPGDQISRSSRFALWKESFRDIRAKPIAGMGIHGVQLKIENDFYGPSQIWTETHNIFIQSALERGIIGFGLLLWIITIGFLLILRSPQPWKSSLSGTMGAFVVAGLTESWLNDMEIAIIFWALLGAAEFFRRRENVESKTKASW